MAPVGGKSGGSSSGHGLCVSDGCAGKGAQGKLRGPDVPEGINVMFAPLFKKTSGLSSAWNMLVAIYSAAVGLKWLHFSAAWERQNDNIAEKLSDERDKEVARRFNTYRIISTWFRMFLKLATAKKDAFDVYTAEASQNKILIEKRVLSILQNAMTNYQRAGVLSKFTNIKKFREPPAEKLKDTAIGRNPADVRSLFLMQTIFSIWTKNDLPARRKEAATEEGDKQVQDTGGCGIRAALATSIHRSGRVQGRRGQNPHVVAQQQQHPGKAIQQQQATNVAAAPAVAAIGGSSGRKTAAGRNKDGQEVVNTNASSGSGKGGTAQVRGTSGAAVSEAAAGGCKEGPSTCCHPEYGNGGYCNTSDVGDQTATAQPHAVGTSRRRRAASVAAVATGGGARGRKRSCIGAAGQQTADGAGRGATAAAPLTPPSSPPAASSDSSEGSGDSGSNGGQELHYEGAAAAEMKKKTILARQRIAGPTRVVSAAPAVAGAAGRGNRGSRGGRKE
ncbi:hypothetical protein Vretifemale_12287 [Volvox reticuliferus]|uniref:Uncharacterized protein n=3 Tax=Volvox reticuliferus TaxID=1737510 RepID=A0A8J4FQZ4_9CHLO|nr:hypothetical protein Vretifemale_12287 [Volvox reticuliferus]